MHCLALVMGIKIPSTLWFLRVNIAASKPRRRHQIWCRRKAFPTLDYLIIVKLHLFNILASGPLVAAIAHPSGTGRECLLKKKWFLCVKIAASKPRRRHQIWCRRKAFPTLDYLIIVNNNLHLHYDPLIMSQKKSSNLVKSLTNMPFD